MSSDATQINAMPIIRLFKKYGIEYNVGYDNIHCNHRIIQNNKVQLNIILPYPTNFIFMCEPLNIDIDGVDFNDSEVLESIENALNHISNLEN